MPDRFQQPEWDDVRITKWAYSIGTNTGEVIDWIFASVKVKEQGYNPSLSVLWLSKTYSEARLETACEMALTHVRTPRYHHLKAILSANQDQTYLEQKKASLRKPSAGGMSRVQLIMEVEAMINGETKRKLREMNLSEVISALELQQADVNTITLSFDERLQRVVDYLYQEKYNNKIQRLIKLSKFRLPKAEVNDIYYHQRGIDRNTIQELSTYQFIHSNTHVIFQGFTGSGKTYLACAIGKQACKQQIRTRYIRLPDLLAEHDEATMVQHSNLKLLKKYSCYTLLIIDE